MDSPPAADDPRVTRTAYYGTSQVEAAAILEGRFLPRHGEEQYLGTGVYFFDGGPEDATRWAQQRSPREWAVLRCTVDLGRCLDLHTRTGSELLAQLVRDLSAVRREKLREAAAIKLLARFTVIDTVRAVHRRPRAGAAAAAAAGRPLSLPDLPARSTSSAARSVSSPTAAEVRSALQTIICVRNLANIQRVETYRIGD